MELGGLHVVAACTALTVGLAVLLRRKGGSWHVWLGRAYLAAMLVVNVPVLFLQDATGGPGAFHALAVVSLVTTALGWWSLRGARRARRSTQAHASFMTWSWIGVASAGLAQLGNQQWPEQSPWPVVSVVAASTVIGLVVVPPYVSRQLRLRLHGRAGAAVGAGAAAFGQRR